MTFKDVNVGDTIYCIFTNNTEVSVRKSNVVNIEMRNGYKIIYHGRSYYEIPFNHLSASKIKANEGYMLFLSKKVFKKYYTKQLEKLIESEEQE